MTQRRGSGVFGAACAIGGGSSCRIAESVSGTVDFWKAFAPVTIS